MLPNFFVIGAMKCGTTSLCYLLNQHPDVFVVHPKDTYFLSDDDVYAKGFSWYESLFKDAAGASAVGEGTDNYTKHFLRPNTVDRLSRHFPDARLIYITRNPFRQIESAWMHCRVHRHDLRPFEQAIRNNPDYLDMCDYLKQIDLYRQHFPDDRILVLFLEDLAEDPQALLKRCFRFLGVSEDYFVPDAEQPHNVGTERWGDRLPLHALRHFPLGQAALDATPESIRTFFKPVFKWRMRKKPEWPPQLRQMVTDHLLENTSAFLSRYGKLPDFWEMGA